MTTQAPTRQADTRKRVWTDSVEQLVDKIADWARGQGWAIHRDMKAIRESEVGDYTVPFLRVRTPYAELHVDPIALSIHGGGDGRVDLQAWPSLHRVRLIRRGRKWEVITESNVPLRRPWSRQTFVQLALDLTGKPSDER